MAASGSVAKTSLPGTRDIAWSTFWGLAAAALVILGIYFGSRGLRDFDPALVSYAGASVFSAFGLGYRYAMWLRRPPTRMYWRRGWSLFLRPKDLARNLARFVALIASTFVAQRFIERRSRLRWAAHFCISWGCILAALVTFPLSFGWIRFETAPNSEQFYQAFVFNLHVLTFHLGTWYAELLFDILDVAAVLVLAGIFFSLWRRARDRGALAVQQFSADLLPLALLFLICITGLALTASTHLLRGYHYDFLSETHAVVVIFTLLYLPFGKFFHIFQRPAQLSIHYYREAGASGVQAVCARCGQPFASQMHVDDLKQVQRELQIRFQMQDGAHYQDVCPACRRKQLALTQDALWQAARVDRFDRLDAPPTGQQASALVHGDLHHG